MISSLSAHVVSIQIGQLYCFLLCLSELCSYAAEPLGGSQASRAFCQSRQMLRSINLRIQKSGLGLTSQPTFQHCSYKVGKQDDGLHESHSCACLVQIFKTPGQTSGPSETLKHVELRGNAKHRMCIFLCLQRVSNGAHSVYCLHSGQPSL